MNTPTLAPDKSRHRTMPKPGTLTPVPGYPSKLVVYQLEASRYWWVRYYTGKKIVRRSTRTEKKNEAIAFAKQFFADIEARVRTNQPLTTRTTFPSVAKAMLKAMEAEVARQEITKETYENTKSKLNAGVLPFFNRYEVADIHYSVLEEYLNHVSHQTPKLSPNTIKGRMQIVHRVMVHAVKHRLIQSIPHFPTVPTTDNPRGYFRLHEYRKLRSRALSLIGKRFESRRLLDDKGNELPSTYFAEGTCDEGRLIRKIEITRELYEMIVFMVNSYIRPTDLKNMANKHVAIVENDHRYLRLSIPTSKRHSQPIVTQPRAVDVYNRLREYNKATGRGVGPEDYVFFPNFKNRSNALKVLQRQFDVLTWTLGYSTNATGQERTIYSLRHTCIMYRLLHGEKMDHTTLAANARTSPEMIYRFYAAQLKGEDNVDMLHSHRRRRRSRTPVPE